jgi:periplasmic protein TonB
MTKRFFPYFGTVVFLHVLVLIGTWHLSKSDFIQSEIQKLGRGAINLQVASHIMSSATVQKKVARAIPVNPDKPRPTPEEKKSVSAKEATQSETTSYSTTEGSEFGTAPEGRTDQLSLYKAELRATIDKNKSYPTMSRRLGQTGTVVVAFTLLEDGHIIDVRIEKPSRYDSLNSSALDAVKKVKRFKPIPKDLGETKLDITVPVKFITI